MVSLTHKTGTSTARTAASAARLGAFCPVIVVMLAMSACDAMSRGAPHRGTPVVVDDTMLRYPDSSTLAPGAGGLTFIGQLEAEKAAPFVVIAAHGCEACGAADAVLVRAPSAGRVTPGDTRGEHPSPGRALDADGTVRALARVFWGQCMPQRPSGVISFRTEYGWPGDDPLREVRISEVHGDTLIDWRAVAEVRALAATLQQVRARRCRELPARDQSAAP